MTAAFPVTVYHNPKCGTSRNVVAMVEAAGYAPTVVEYLKTGWTRALLLELSTRAGLPLRALVREKGAPAEALELLGEDASDDTILAAMVAYPILVNRPIVSTPKGVVLARPSETVYDVLDRAPASFTKEDGEVVRR